MPDSTSTPAKNTGKRNNTTETRNHQLAYYEKYDYYGIEAFWKTVDYAKKKRLIVIADAKRGDIGSTSQAYAETFYKNTADEWSSTLSVDAEIGRAHV